MGIKKDVITTKFIFKFVALPSIDELGYLFANLFISVLDSISNERFTFANGELEHEHFQAKSGKYK